MQRLVETLPAVAASAATVLVEGESGTGKELVARALHDLSPRRDAPFVAVSCGAIPDTLVESELFGHRAGAFTDARRDRQGRFELASSGTILLDEVAHLSPSAQIKLLRVLQEHQVESLGADRPTPVDVRVIAATNVRLSDLVGRGEFREDLFYRLSVIPISVPPLRDRREDLPLLIDRLLMRLVALHGKEVSGVSDRAMQALYAYDFPGNVRELENALAHGVALCRHGVIELGDLPRGFSERASGTTAGRNVQQLRERERRVIEDTLRRHLGHRGATARELGIDPSTLYRKLKRCNLAVPPQDGRRRVAVEPAPRHRRSY
jgi:transcriptional regulator with PAS, ATPase and Fis domain